MWVLCLLGRGWIGRWDQNLYIFMTLCCAQKYQKLYLYHQTNGKKKSTEWLGFQTHVSNALFSFFHIPQLIPCAPSILLFPLPTEWTLLRRLSAFVSGSSLPGKSSCSSPSFNTKLSSHLPHLRSLSWTLSANSPNTSVYIKRRREEIAYLKSWATPQRFWLIDLGAQESVS